MNKNLLKKLGKYTATTGAALAASVANADIIYTPVDADTSLLIGLGGSFTINMDGVGVDEFDLSIQAANSWARIRNNTASSFAVIAGNYNTSNTYYKAYNLPSNATVGASGYNFLTFNAFATLAYKNFYSYGDFHGVNDGFIGVRFAGPDGFANYGWIRVDVATDGTSITLKDWAWNDLAGDSILTGQMPTYADTATNVVMSDISDNLDASDLQITFDKANDETNIEEYRVFVVDSANANGYTLADARAVISANRYKVITPNGSNQTVNFVAGDNDVDGFDIETNKKYAAFVVSVPKGAASNHVISGMSNIIEFTATAVPADTAMNLVASDVNDNFNGSDLEISFDKIADESSISEYNAFIVKTVNASMFNLDSAQANANGVTIAKTGANLTYNFNATAKDTDGDSILPGTSYNVFIMTVGTSIFTNSLSASSNDITLSLPVAGAVSGLNASDATNNYDASDFRVIFDPAANEAEYVEEYEVFVIKAVSGTFLSQADAEANSNGVTIATTGNKIIQTLPASTKDTDGDAIAMGVAYKFYVLSKGKNGAGNSFAGASNEVTLSTAPSSINKSLSQNINLFVNSNNLEVNSNLSVNEMDILSIDGKNIISISENNISNVDISSLDNGVYIAILSTDEGTTTKKFVK